MGVFLRLDAAVLDAYERFAHWVQRWMGYTTFFLARVAGFSWVAINSFEMMSRVRSEGLVFGVKMKFGMILVMLFIMGVTYTFEGRMIERLLERHGNPRKIDPTLRLVRISLLVFLPLEAVFAIASLIAGTHTAYHVAYDISDSLTYLSFHYFFACDPLPPSPGRLGELLRGFGRKEARSEV